MTTYEYDHPNWLPLKARLPIDEVAGFMWMYRMRHGDRVIETYKHITTRRYLHLDQDGQAWQPVGTRPGCDPWCGETHKHRAAAPPDIRSVPFGEALEWALS